MTSIRAINNQDYNTSLKKQHTFKGSLKTSETGATYHKGNVGMIAGSIAAIPPVLIGISTNKLLSSMTDESSKLHKEMIVSMEKSGVADTEINEFLNMAKKAKSKAIVNGLILGLASIGCGLLVDHLTNKKSKEAADTIQMYGPQQAFQNGLNLEMLPSGEIYYKSNQGSKLGALLGVGVAGLSTLLSYSTQSIPKGANPEVVAAMKGNSIKTFIINAIGLGLGGWIMGKITDHYNNNSAEDKMMKQYYQNSYN